MSPNLGRRRELGPGGEEPPGDRSLESHAATLKRLLPYLWPAERRDLRLRVVLAVVVLVLAKVATVYVPILLGRTVDTLSEGANAPVALAFGLLAAYGLARAGSLGLAQLRDAIFIHVAQHAAREVARRIFRHLHSLSLRFHLERQTGGLSRSLDRGIKGIEFLLFFVLFNILPTLIELALVCGILWWLFDWRFAAVTLVTVGLYVWFTFKITDWRIDIRRRMNEADNEANTRAIDSLLNFETVKYFGNEEHESRRYDRGLAGYERASVQSRVSLSILNAGQALVVTLGMLAAMGMAAAEVLEGARTVGDFVAVNAYLMQIAMPLGLVGTVYREIKQALVDMEAMFALLDQNSEIQDKPGALALAAPRGEVRFEGVDFGYDPRRSILHDVGFTLPAGGTLGIVGASGAGKSTIGRLLFRFYDPLEGRILLDGHDLRDLTVASLRAAIGVVPQDTVLFNDTVLYNIRYGRPEATSEEIEAAARQAELHDFIVSLPDGYETMVGERGLKLSGGEKQRVAIARALLKAPTVFLFDEATSSLDTATEQQIQRSLDEVSRGRTTLIIAHRLSTVREADQIVVLDAGRVVERGTHTDLLARRGRYWAMWQRQQEEPEEGAPALAG